MYKTVRHGENSLQYTILPQTEEILSNSGLKGRGRDYSPSIHIRRSKRKSTVKYIILIVFGIIVALAVASIPLYVMKGTLYSRRNIQIYNQEEVITATPVSPTIRDINKSRKKELKTYAAAVPLLKVSGRTSLAPSTTTQTSTVTNERSTTPQWSMPALRSWKSSTPSTTSPPIPVIGSHVDIPLITPSNEISAQLTEKLITEKSWKKDENIKSSTLPPLPSSTKNNAKLYSYDTTSDKVTLTTNKIKHESDTKKLTTIKALRSTTERSKLQELKDMLFSDDYDDEFKNSLEIDEVFTLPPLKSDYSVPAVEADDVTVSKTTNSGWYAAKWPFVDTSSYFQWTVSVILE